MICDHTIQIDIRKVPKNRRPLPDVVSFDGTRFETTWTETNFGGMRQWFLCPNCGRRCAIIYRVGIEPKRGCRLCLNGHYISEHMSPTDRRLHAAFKVRERLGQTKGGIVVRFPPKPKGMHWRTYEGIRFAALSEESEILLADYAAFLGVSLQQARNSFL